MSTQRIVKWPHTSNTVTVCEFVFTPEWEKPPEPITYAVQVECTGQIIVSMTRRGNTTGHLFIPAETAELMAHAIQQASQVHALRSGGAA